MTTTLHGGDAVQWAKDYEGSPFMSMLCDPPYHLVDITKRFGKENAAPAQFGSDGAYQRMSKGFMGTSWDGHSTDGNLVAFQPETWQAFKRILYPGAFGFAFASTRGLHRMMVAIEDAGFIIHPTIFLYAFASGFPKATNISAQIDRQAGAERNVSGKDPHSANRKARSWTASQCKTGMASGNEGERMLTEPTTDLAKVWSGHRYGGQALKPAVEPIICFQKPYKGRPLDCITQTGAGALNIDAARIGGGLPHHNYGRTSGAKSFTGKSDTPFNTPHTGRWPSNLLIEAGEAAERLDAQSGYLKSGSMKAGTTRSNLSGFTGNMPTLTASDTPADSGGASRFFFQVQTQIDEADPLFYTAKASGAERNAGLEGMPLTFRKTHGEMKPDESGNSHNTTGQKPAEGRNPHPTVKNLSLTRYLASLLLPPADYAPRRIFCPFAGSGSEMIGAHLAGWEEITGVELTPDYIPVAEARIRFWSNNSGLFESLCQPDEEDEEEAQSSLFGDE